MSIKHVRYEMGEREGRRHGITSMLFSFVLPFFTL